MTSSWKILTRVWLNTTLGSSDSIGLISFSSFLSSSDLQETGLKKKKVYGREQLSRIRPHLLDLHLPLHEGVQVLGYLLDHGVRLPPEQVNNNNNNK